MDLAVMAAPSAAMAFSNCVYVAPDVFAQLARPEGGSVEVLGRAFKVLAEPTVPSGRLALTSPIRNFLNVELDRAVTVRPFVQPADETLYLDSITFSTSLHGSQRLPAPVEVDCRELSQSMAAAFAGQVLVIGQEVVHRYQGKVLRMTVSEIAHVPNIKGDSAGGPQADPKNEIVAALKAGAGGVLIGKTSMTFNKRGDTPLRLTGQVSRRSASNMINTDFEKLGIGGLDKEFGDIFRRAFVSRILPPDVVKKLGIKHVRGMMLHGPPGTGKTLIARQISRVLQGGETAREPKIVSGPDILSKYVGESEKNVRELFAEAEEEQMSAGDESELHVIIFDEIDAICRQRGAKRDGTGVGDSVVNQLLAKIDGVNSLNNVLLIGMTNRLDMIDSALLRPGRFEVQVEIGLPDEKGRVQILNIHTKSMRDGGCMDPSIDIAHLAANTKNYSGAEIEGLVKSAVSYATQRHINAEDISKLLDADKIMVRAQDFESALEEVRPAFGVQGEEEMRGLYRNGIIRFSDGFLHLDKTLQDLSIQSQTSARTPLLSVLLGGEKGAGKTALVAKMATEAGFHFTKMVSADGMIGMGEHQKCSHLAQIFEDAYKSPISLIVLDDIERLIDFVPIGPRFSNLVLQSLLVLINKPPPREDRKLMVVGTTAVPHLMEELGLAQVFNVSLALPLLQSNEEVVTVLQHMTAESVAPLHVDKEQMALIADACHKPIAIKKLLVTVEMARQGEGPLTVDRFKECLLSIGY